MPQLFADIILPLAIREKLTYSVPDEMSCYLRPGIRVMVPLGSRRIYSGIVARIHDKPPEVKNIRPIIRTGDRVPVVNETQLKLWRWMADYYMCSEGEVMKAAVPSAFLPCGETSSKIIEKYKPKEEIFIELARHFSDDELNDILDRLKMAPKQEKALTAYLHITGYGNGSDIRPVRKSLLSRESGAAPGIIGALIKKEILKSVSLKVGRLKEYGSDSEPPRMLSDIQQDAFDSVKTILKSKDIVLLHGVTSSGKTEIYIHMIEEQLELGKQVLYMLPEIALTAQIIIRMQKHFGRVTGVYHSRFNDLEKVEIWKKTADENPETGYRLIIGVRSSVFLPFSNLGLVIIDEEHDGSYKQHDPAPRYNGRDSAIILAGLHGAKTILGSASPSIESYYNAVNGKYGLAVLKERYGHTNLPSIIVADTREATRKKRMVSHFTPEMLNAIDEALGKNEQVILFQNRRGFSPYIECPECGWIPKCRQCAVRMTYHKSKNSLICHYCGYTTSAPVKCSSCGSGRLVTKGFGTEKIEDEIKIVFPFVRTARMDQDTTRGRNSIVRIIKDFEEHRTDILVGTQMISKGLDFENLTVVGILNADNMLNYPDFRAHERSFQLIEQVSGRAGRRNRQGKVIIQTSNPSDEIIKLVLRHDYDGMYRMQSGERAAFNYPPFSRMIRISLKHKDQAALNGFAGMLGADLKNIFGKRVFGPEFPLVSQVQLFYIKTLIIKLEREISPAKAKEAIMESVSRLEKAKGLGSLKIAIDVDPY